MPLGSPCQPTTPSNSVFLCSERPPALPAACVFVPGEHQPVSEVSWPTGLQQLSFGHRFDPSSLNGLVWPVGLKAIKVGRISRAVNEDRRIYPWRTWDEAEG